jgi:hypothetical protein
MHWKRVTLATLCVATTLSLLASGCASLSKRDCLEGDWERIGRQDASQGQPPTQLQKHREACTEYGVVPDKARYEAGYQDGLAVYCTPSNGFRLGKEGALYQSVCPASLEGAFLARYRAGREIYQIEEQLRGISQRMITLEGQLDKETSEAGRRRIREDLYRLRDERDELQRRLTVLEVRNE